MINKDVLELLNMFQTAAKIAKSKNMAEYQYNLQEAVLFEFFKKAFPTLANNANIQNIVKNIAQNDN